MRGRRLILAVAAGLALADASIVTLALPELLHELDTTVTGVAAVLGVYTVVLAAALLPAERLQRRAGAPRVGAAGIALFGAASAVAGLAGSLTLLLAARAVQAVGGAAALVAVFALLAPGGEDRAGGRRVWLGAAVLASGAGPALGGALTEGLSWRAIFLVQVPVAALAAWVCLREPAPAPRARDPRDVPRISVRELAGPALALALLSAALTAVLFLLVLLLVAGWDVAPLAAAVTVTVIPLGALLGARLPGPPRTRAATGCALVGAGVLALAFLPDARLWWTIAPQAAAGIGMGLALPALGGDLLPERTPRDAAALLTLRHAGIALALAVLAPVVTSTLTDATDRARERGVAIVLDARLPLVKKLELAPGLLEGIESQRPRTGLRAALAAGRSSVDEGDRAEYAAFGRRVDETLVSAVGEAFRAAFLITGAFALLAALVLLPAPSRALGAALAAAVVLPLGFLGLHAALAPEPVPLRSSCEARPLPRTGGLDGLVQDQALQVLDAAACRLHVRREELVLALLDPAERRAFLREHAVDPRTVVGILGRFLK